MPDTATAFAPGSVGNIGPGLDILGLAFTGAGDTATLSWRDDGQFVIDDPGHPDLSTDPELHSAAIAAREVLWRHGALRGVTLRVVKGLPLSGGQGGSAASAVAGAVAADYLCGAGMTTDVLLECALVAEERVAGRHADNLAPSLLGGMVLIRSLDPIDVMRLPVPAGLRIVLVHPAQRLATRTARAALPQSIPRQLALQQAANVAAMVAAGFLDDAMRFGAAIEDGIAEPVRAPLLPGFAAARLAALGAGALGCSISGAGPTAFALTTDDDTASVISAAMVAAYAASEVAAEARVALVDTRGAWVT
jgi:homoserine kinase